ncbi:MAG TPA: hypothetical protein VNW30_05205 [Opitutaceae bacterium]|jgi:hypothetical protein|nr:hypothetical protein [Opitutaceae bacterium]
MPLPIPNYREIVDLIKKGATIEAQEKIMELRAAALALQEENLTLREENRHLKESQEMNGQLVRIGNCYFMKDDTDRKKPYCMACWDADRKLVSLILGHNSFGGRTISCNICEAKKKDT